MNSGAPASTAPPDFSSLGRMVSQRNSSVAYCGTEKYFGVYAPAGAAGFFFWTIWGAYSAASAGEVFKNEAAAGARGGGGGGCGRGEWWGCGVLPVREKGETNR